MHSHGGPWERVLITTNGCIALRDTAAVYQNDPRYEVAARIVLEPRFKYPMHAVSRRRCFRRPVGSERRGLSIRYGYGASGGSFQHHRTGYRGPVAVVAFSHACYLAAPRHGPRGRARHGINTTRPHIRGSPVSIRFAVGRPHPFRGRAEPETERAPGNRGHAPKPDRDRFRSHVVFRRHVGALHSRAGSAPVHFAGRDSRRDGTYGDHSASAARAPRRAGRLDPQVGGHADRSTRRDARPAGLPGNADRWTHGGHAGNRVRGSCARWASAVRRVSRGPSS